MDSRKISVIHKYLGLPLFMSLPWATQVGLPDLAELVTLYGGEAHTLGSLGRAPGNPDSAHSMCGHKWHTYHDYPFPYPTQSGSFFKLLQNAFQKNWRQIPQ